MRGKDPLLFTDLDKVRITPAYAGKSLALRHPFLTEWDHPRVCGEKTKIKRPFTVNAGSPPRMRGKVLAARLYDLVNGITPAYAGKSDCLFQHGALFQDHPRVCGEKYHSTVPGAGHLGSPPRMRGKGEVSSRHAQQHGITPAYAGKSIKKTKAFIEYGDHPRVCGEKYTTFRNQLKTAGSPPRMRGKVAEIFLGNSGGGITPAYAGKRRERMVHDGHGGDHPRVCGEKSFKTSISCGYRGSPPRMRGKVMRVCMATGLRGITPAYAGKSTGRGRTALFAGDHPRVCGEKSQSTSASRRALGSPPRMRGKAHKRKCRWG